MTIRASIELQLPHNCVEDTVHCSLHKNVKIALNQLSQNGCSLPETRLGTEVCHVPQMLPKERCVCTQRVPNLKGPHMADVTRL